MGSRSRTEDAARAVPTALRIRGIAEPDAVRTPAEKDPMQIERWHERAILAASIAERLDEPSRAARRERPPPNKALHPTVHLGRAAPGTAPRV